MDTTPCPFCEAPLKPTATFCLACDSPVVPQSSRLSVGDPVRVQMGRPAVGLAVVAATLLALGGAAFGTVAFVRHQHAATRAEVVRDVTDGARLLAEAEGGDAAACRGTARVLAGPGEVVRQECAAVVGLDRGLRVDRIVVDRPDLAGSAGTARVRETVTDDAGTRTVERVVHLVRQARVWRLSWDGHATV